MKTGINRTSLVSTLAAATLFLSSHALADDATSTMPVNDAAVGHGTLGTDRGGAPGSGGDDYADGNSAGDVGFDFLEWLTGLMD